MAISETRSAIKLRTLTLNQQ